MPTMDAPHPDPAAVAAMEEARLARAISEITSDFRLIGGADLDDGAAVASRAEPGSWLNSIVNLGMSGRSVDPDELRSVVEWYAEAGIEPRVELCPYARASAAKGLASLGFVPSPREGGEGSPGAFETVLFRGLSAGEVVEALSELPRDVKIVTVDPADDASVDEYASVMLSGFMPPGVSPAEADRETVRRCVKHPRTTTFAAVVGDERRIIATGGLESHGEVAALFGATVLPEFRRRGIQQALIAARLNAAAERGARVATIGSRPGIPTERNVRRMGFQVAYTKVILVRPGPGLVGVKE